MATTTSGTITAADAASVSATVGEQTLTTGTPTAGSAVSATGADQATVMITLSGTWTGPAVFEKQVAGAGWLALPLRAANVTLKGETSRPSSNGEWEGELGPNTGVRVRGLAPWTGTASATIVTQSGGGGGGGGAATVADGADATQGATTDAPVDVVEDATPRTVESILKGVKNYLRLMKGMVLSAGTAIIGKVGIDQSTPGTTNAVVATGLSAVGATPTLNPVSTAGVDAGGLKRHFRTDSDGAQVLAAGSNTVGSVTFASTLDPVNDSLRAFQVFGRLYDSAVPPNALTVKRKRATITATSATSIVPAVTSKQIQVIGYTIQSQGANTPSLNFQDDAGSPVVLSRTWKLDATGVAGVNSVLHTPGQLGCGVDPTTAGQALMGKMDATGSVVVEVSYIEV